MENNAGIADACADKNMGCTLWKFVKLSGRVCKAEYTQTLEYKEKGISSYSQGFSVTAHRVMGE